MKSPIPQPLSDIVSWGNGSEFKPPLYTLLESMGFETHQTDLF